MSFNLQQALDEGAMEQIAAVLQRETTCGSDSLERIFADGDVDVFDASQNMIYIADYDPISGEMYGFMTASVDLEEFDNDTTISDYALSAFSPPNKIAASNKMGYVGIDEVIEEILSRMGDFYAIEFVE